MTIFATNPGVNSFETGGPNGVLRVESGKPFRTTDPVEISLLEAAGYHALTKTADAAPAPAPKHALAKGGDA